MEEEGSCVVEWSIYNFGCWNYDIHDLVITSPKSSIFADLTIELYPRGLSGQEDFLEVRLSQGFRWTSSDDLSYLSSDGSLICKEQGDSSSWELPPGPKFDEVIAQIRKNESVYKDSLTIRLRDKRGNSVEYMCTTIDAFDASIKISPKVLEDFEYFSEATSRFTYHLDEGEMEQLVLFYTKDHMDELLLTLKPDYLKKNVLVFTRMTVLNSDENVVVGIEENEWLFRNEDPWTFLSLTREKIESRSLVLHLKIIPSNKPKHSLGSFYDSPLYVQGVSSSPSNRLLGSSEGYSKSPITDTSIQPGESMTVLAKELMSLFQDQDFSDVQLQCGDVSFPVHKAILSARSPVFKRLLSSDMKESLSGVVHIVDLNSPTLSHFLGFIYTGGVEELEVERAIELYYAADKYQVPSLQRKCANFLSANVSISNVCDILSLGDKHQDEQLTSVAHDFMLGNYHKVLRSEDWKSFMRSEPLLAVQTLTDLAVKNFVTIRKAM